MDNRPKNKTKHKQQIALITPSTLPSKRKQKNNGAESDQGRELPATEVTIVRGSEQSLTSSIRIGEFGMKTTKKGNMTTFAMAIRENLFQMVKFLGGTNTSLDYSTEPTSICGGLI